MTFSLSKTLMKSRLALFEVQEESQSGQRSLQKSWVCFFLSINSVIELRYMCLRSKIFGFNWKITKLNDMSFVSGWMRSSNASKEFKNLQKKANFKSFTLNYFLKIAIKTWIWCNFNWLKVCFCKSIKKQDSWLWAVSSEINKFNDNIEEKLKWNSWDWENC